MVNPKARPILQALDVSVPPRPAELKPPATDPNDARFADAEQFETREAVMRGMMSGTVRTLNPDTMPRSVVEPARQRSPEVSLSTRIPEYVMRELRRRYADTGVTIRVQVLQALIGKGFEVDENDLHDERKNPRR